MALRLARKSFLFVLLAMSFIVPNIADANNVLNSSLLSAVSLGDAVKVKSLLAQGASVNSKNTTSGYSALMASTIHGDTTILKMLLAAGADVNVKTTTGETALLYAVMANNTAAAKELVGRGADVKAKTGMGISPVDMAKTMRNTEMLIALKQAVTTTNDIASNTSLAFTTDAILEDFQKKIDGIQSSFDNQMAKITSGYSANTGNNGLKLDVVIDERSVFLDFSQGLVSRAQNDISKIKQGDNWNEKLAHFLGSKQNDRFLEHSAPQRYQIITPYTLIRDNAYSASRRYQELDQDVVETLRPYDGIVWLWVWDQGKYDRAIGMPHGTLMRHIVIKVGEKVYQPLDRDIYTPSVLFAEKGIYTIQTWPFPASIFVKENCPMEIIAFDKNDRKYILNVPIEKLERISER